MLPHLPIAQPKVPTEAHASAHSVDEAWGFCLSEHSALTAITTLVPVVPLVLWGDSLVGGILDQAAALEVGLLWCSGPEAAAAGAEANTRERRKRGHRYVALTAKEIFKACTAA